MLMSVDDYANCWPGQRLSTGISQFHIINVHLQMTHFILLKTPTKVYNVNST